MLGFSVAFGFGEFWNFGSYFGKFGVDVRRIMNSCLASRMVKLENPGEVLGEKNLFVGKEAVLQRDYLNCVHFMARQV